MSRYFHRFRPGPYIWTLPFWRATLTKAAYTSVGTLQFACAIHLVNEHVFEVRNSTGASMLPTLAPEGDFLFQLRLPFASLLDTIGNFFSAGSGNPTHPRIGGPAWSKSDPAQGTGLKVGDLVVALSPFDPSRAVCKRVIGLPGDTVCLDPRMRPLPESAWRGRKATPPPSKDELESKMVRFEDLLSSVGAPSAPTTPKRTSERIGEIDLLKSMDTDPDSTEDTQAHNSAALKDLQSTYVRSKGDVQYVTVPLGHVWLAGDNLANSTDSRHYGPVPLGMVRGKVLARAWPNPRWLTNGIRLYDDGGQG